MTRFDVMDPKHRIVVRAECTVCYYMCSCLKLCSYVVLMYHLFLCYVTMSVHVCYATRTHVCVARLPVDPAASLFNIVPGRQWQHRSSRPSTTSGRPSLGVWPWLHQSRPMQHRHQRKRRAKRSIQRSVGAASLKPPSFPYSASACLRHRLLSYFSTVNRTTTGDRRWRTSRRHSGHQDDVFGQSGLGVESRTWGIKGDAAAVEDVRSF